MKSIFVHVKCELGRAYEVAGAAAEIEQVSEVYSTSGEYDLLLKCYIGDDADAGHFVCETVQRMDGVRDTYTLITFKAF